MNGLLGPGDPESDMLKPREGLVGFEVTGKDPKTWARLRASLMLKVESLVTLVQGDDPAATWFREQAKDFRDLGIDNLKARLRKQGVEVEQIEANVAKLFAEAEEALA